ncbi:hypothetical protein MTBUT4_70022 [Magnetospirillum sp. UT-4]|nr:hypothetical protein MTBUT4_70022 [Magnetospirillum sp. UT-4]
MWSRDCEFPVIPGLDPGVHACGAMDGRVKPGHDGK